MSGEVISSTVSLAVARTERTFRVARTGGGPRRSAHVETATVARIGEGTARSVRNAYLPRCATTTVRRNTRRLVVVLALVGLGLLALGALPSYLGSGDPYYLTATETDESGTAVNATGLPEHRYPYLTEALATGRSEGYQTGQWGLKEQFTHTPYDELDALATREPDARVGEQAVLVEYQGQRYRVEVEQA